MLDKAIHACMLDEAIHACMLECHAWPLPGTHLHASLRSHVCYLVAARAHEHDVMRQVTLHVDWEVGPAKHSAAKHGTPAAGSRTAQDVSGTAAGHLVSAARISPAAKVGLNRTHAGFGGLITPERN